MSSGFQATRSAVSLALAATIFALPGCTPAPPHQPDATIQTTVTDGGTVSRGKVYTFDVTLSNPGPRTVEDIDAEVFVDSQVRLESVRCSAVGLTCPAPSDGGQIVDMPPGATVTFTYSVMPLATASGTLSNVETTTIAQGPKPTTSTSHATVAETRSGHYAAFATTGVQYGLDIDFVANSATFTGSGSPIVAPFTTTGIFRYAFSGAGQFSTPTDLVVGSADFGQGPRPFVAARNFATTLAEVDGASFNTFALDTASAGTATSEVRPAWISGATLSTCVDTTQHSAATCPVADQRQYALTLTSNLFTATDAAHGDTWTFQVAKSEASMILLSAGPTASGAQFRIGLASLVGAPARTGTAELFGADASGNWIGAAPSGFDLSRPLLLTLYNPVAGGGNTATDPSTLSPVIGGPAALVVGALPGTTGAASEVYFTEDDTLGLLAGDPAGAADGYLAILSY